LLDVIHADQLRFFLSFFVPSNVLMILGTSQRPSSLQSSPQSAWQKEKSVRMLDARLHDLPFKHEAKCSCTTSPSTRHRRSVRLYHLRPLFFGP